jgi:GTP-binding protein HflX
LNSDESDLVLEHTRAIAVALRVQTQPLFEVDEHLDELEELAKSAGCTVEARVVQARSAPHARSFIGEGKAEQVGLQAKDLGCDLVIFDDDLSPSQVKNLEKIIGLPVLDRSALILQLFRQRAKTKEARTQVELAQLQYMLPRLTRFWRHLGRQAGGIGQRGGEGEKQLEMDRRMLRRRIGRLERDLETIARTRNTQRQGRRDAFQVSLTGYTNAGKSTLFNRLTRSDAFVQDRLFATLDSKLRKGTVGEGRTAIFADTVGFVRKLPHHLVASFRSTLEEVTAADLVLHVIDISHPTWEDQRRVGEEILADLGVEESRILTVFNKVDRLPSGAYSGPECRVSATTGEGIEALRKEIRERMPLHEVPTWAQAEFGP